MLRQIVALMRGIGIMSDEKMIADERLDELQRLADAATPGPWETDGGAVVETADPIVDTPYGPSAADVYEVLHYGEDGAKHHCPTAKFIAAARTAIPYLLAEVRRLQAEVHELTDPRYSRVSNERLQENHDAMLELQAENAALREALRPFAAEGGAWRNRRLKDEEWISGYALMRDLRRAAKLVEDTEC